MPRDRPCRILVFWEMEKEAKQFESSFGSSLNPNSFKEVLPIIKVQIYGIKCFTLADFVCSRFSALNLMTRWGYGQPEVSGQNTNFPIIWQSTWTSSVHIWQEYQHELQTWLDNGWLLPYPEKELGLSKGQIPLMVVLQQNKNKVHPILDFHELNGACWCLHSLCWCLHSLCWCLCPKTERREKRAPMFQYLISKRLTFIVHMFQSLWPL